MLDYQYFNVWIDEGKQPVACSRKLQAQDRGIFLAVSIWLNTKKPGWSSHWGRFYQAGVTSGTNRRHQIHGKDLDRSGSTI